MSTDQFDQELEELLVDELTLYRFTGKDTHGNPVYSETGQLVDAYYEDVRARGGPQDTAETFGPGVSFAGTLWCRPVGIVPRDKLVLDNGDTLYVLTAKTYRNVPERGPHHQEITLTERN